MIYKHKGKSKQIKEAVLNYEKWRENFYSNEIHLNHLQIIKSAEFAELLSNFSLISHSSMILFK